MGEGSFGATNPIWSRMGHVGDGGLMLKDPKPRNLPEDAAQRILEMYLKAGSELKKPLGQEVTFRQNK